MRFLLKELHARKEPIKLSIRDRKLIQLLIQNSRTSISELAKKVGISKPAVVQKIESLKKKNILLEPVMYTNVKLKLNEKFYLYEIQTYLGMNNTEVNKKILETQGITSVLWYNGPFNLLLVSTKQDPQVIIESLEKIIPINKIRLLLGIDNWFHPPHIFNEIPDFKVRFERSNTEITKLDESILNYLETNSKANLTEIAENVHSSLITVKKRIEEMKKNKAIIHFSSYINWWLCGRDLISVSFIVKGKRNTDLLIEKMLELPQTGNIWEFAHEWNINVVFWVKDQMEINQILSNIYQKCKGILDTEVMVLAGIVSK